MSNRIELIVVGVDEREWILILDGRLRRLHHKKRLWHLKLIIIARLSILVVQTSLARDRRGVCLVKSCAILKTIEYVTLGLRLLILCEGAKR